MKRVFTLSSTVAIAGFGLFSSPAAAQYEPPQTARQYVLDLGAGAIFKPKYPGADKYLVYPFPIIGVGRFFVPGYGQIDSEDQSVRGFFFYPSFDFMGKRKASDARDLVGTTTIDWALELGAGGGYRYDWISAFAEVRQGFNGHKGQVADFGMNFTTNPFGDLKFVFGPRASWASNKYMDTYFGVTPAEAAMPGSILTPYNPSAGFKTVGISARASHPWNDKVTVHLRGEWDRFIGDADKSPIITVGSENQFSIGLGLSYRFAFDVFE
ncbi:MAG: MipA/OmpV family protein [Hyphomicrobiales bacterium]